MRINPKEPHFPEPIPESGSKNLESLAGKHMELPATQGTPSINKEAVNNKIIDLVEQGNYFPMGRSGAKLLEDLTKGDQT